MKKSTLLILLAVWCIINTAKAQPLNTLSTQAVTDITIGSSTNAFTVLGLRSCLYLDPNLNAVTFIHRANPGGGVGVTSGDIYVDASYDGGVNWTTDQGPVYADTTGSNNNVRGRYPHVAIYNPIGNVNQFNAHLTYLASVTDPTATWAAYITGSANLNPVANATQTVTFNPTVPLDGMEMTQQGEVYGYTGLMDVAGAVYQDTVLLLHGVWTGNDMAYTPIKVPMPVAVDSNGTKLYQTCGAAFGAGQTGYVFVSGCPKTINSGFLGTYNPIVSKTTDGGITWTTKRAIDLSAVAPLLGGATGTEYSTWSEIDGVVDMNNNLHMIMIVAPALPNNNIDIVSGNYGLFDIYTTDGGITWKAELLNEPHTFDATFPGAVVEYNRGQAAKTWAGDKLFFGWMDTDTLAFPGSTTNVNPDIHVRAYDVVTGLWTMATNMTQGTDADGICTFLCMSPYVNGATGTYGIPCTYTKLLTGDPAAEAEHHYVDGLTLADADFTVASNAVSLYSYSYNFYTLSGAMYYDGNGNGIKDAGETGMAGRQVNMMPFNVNHYTQSNGSYQFAVDSGQYIISPVIPPLWQITSDSLSYQVNIDSVSKTGFDFGLNSTVTVQEMEVHLTSGTPRCSFQVPYWIQYTNTGTVPLDGSITFRPDTQFTFTSSVPSPDSIVSGIYYWGFTGFNPFGQQTINLVFQMPGAASMGDTLCSVVSADMVILSAKVFAYADTLKEILRCSFDPNDKGVTPWGELAPHYTLMDDTLEYTIRFQNTGNDTAFTVVVSDPLSADLDLNSFELIGSSHAVETEIQPNGVTEFKFNNILLPDSTTNEIGSHGFVKFRIRTKPNTPDYTVINNTGYIYFDFNPAIVTNTTLNTMVFIIPVSINEHSNPAQQLIVYPNPGTGIFNLSATGIKQGELTVYDALGRICLAQHYDFEHATIDLTHSSKGLYIIELKSNDGKILRGKLMKE